MLTVLVGTGMRYAELAALQVRDIEPFAKPVPTLRVRRAWKRQADNTFRLGRPRPSSQGGPSPVPDGHGRDPAEAAGSASAPVSTISAMPASPG
ncbi:hypothetical protein [Nonomuraea guangzhouensis]|uniref:Tyr recombinase domain-containing protein n=1 Tax=Nonomuraea guangzhouensis TaxID=1291555 RepID=A0ABW4GPE0_9ACTN|nr:hypothetical protein [Nonomuraea guangzhouensis]